MNHGRRPPKDLATRLEKDFMMGTWCDIVGARGPGGEQAGRTADATGEIGTREAPFHSLFEVMRQPITRPLLRDEALVSAVLSSVLDTASARVAVLSSDGTIVAANAAWREFADRNGLPDSRHAVGSNYLAVCEHADGSDREWANAAASGIRAVASGAEREFFLAYSTGTPEQRWFEMRVKPLPKLIGVVVAHEATAGGVPTHGTPRGTLDGARTHRTLEAEDLSLGDEDVDHARRFGGLIGRSASIRTVLRKIELVAETDATVLVVGETGTGKELVARAVHARSARRDRPLVSVNCAALPPNLIESELFGHERGAFTGAVGRRRGRFEIADGGTIFLDEVADMPPELQTKLLRVLQEQEFERIGSPTTLHVDVRVIAATNRNLTQAMNAGTFRADLYYRLMVFPIELPPLRERPEDIRLLIRHLVDKHQKVLGKTIEKVATSTLDALCAYCWPGNVRELENVVERAIILSSGPTLCLEENVFELPPNAPETSVRETSVRLTDVERAHIERVLRECRGRIKGRGGAAERLGLEPSTLRSRMKRLRLASR